MNGRKNSPKINPMEATMSDNGYSATKDQVKGFVAGLLFGGVIGAGAALLNAPRSGQETRKQIQMKASEIQGRAERTAGEIRERAQDAGQQVRQQAKAAQTRVQEVSDNGLQRVNELKG